MSNKEAPPETDTQKAVIKFYSDRGIYCGWGRDKHGVFFASFARDVEAAWKELEREIAMLKQRLDVESIPTLVDKL